MYHANLTYLDYKQAPTVGGWRILMQSFVFNVQQIPGTRLGLVDYMSRMYPETVLEEDQTNHVKRNDELLDIAATILI